MSTLHDNYILVDIAGLLRTQGRRVVEELSLRVCVSEDGWFNLHTWVQRHPAPESNQNQTFEAA